MWSRQGPPPPPPQGGPSPLYTKSTGTSASRGGSEVPPLRQQQYDNYRRSYEESDDEDNGALGSTINLVSSAANMFFKPSPPAPPQATAPVPIAGGAPPRGPPPPINPGSSMLDGSSMAGSKPSSTPRHGANPQWEGGPVPSSPLATSNPRVVISQKSPITNSAVAQIAVPSLGHSGGNGSGQSTPKRTTKVTGAFGGNTAHGSGSPAPALPELRTSGLPAETAGSFFGSSPKAASPNMPTPVSDAFTTSSTNSTTIQGEKAGPFPSNKSGGTATDRYTSASIPSLPPRQPATLPRQTPPPSPRVKATIAPPSPSTPLRSNSEVGSVHTNSTPSQNVDDDDPSTTVTSSSPSVNRSLPTPRRQLRAPPPKVTTPASSSKLVTPSRAKFRLPPPRKHKVAPTPTKSSSSPTAPSPRGDVTASPARREEPPATPSTVEAAACSKEIRVTSKGPPSLPTMQHSMPQTIEEELKSLQDTPVEKEAALASVEKPSPEDTRTRSMEEDTSITATATTEPREPPAAVNSLDIGTAKKLAEGWMEVSDSSSGRVYYYNPSTQETTWERPLANIAKRSEAIDDQTTNEAPVEEQALMDVDKRTTISAAVELSTVPEATATDAEPAEELAAVGSPAPEKASSNELPEGWIETIDPSSGRVFYYHAATRETQWERPLASTSNEAALIDQQTTKETPIREATDKDEKVETTAGVELLTVPENTAKTTEISEGYGAAERAAANSDLLEGWAEATHPTTGQLYYYNAATQETSWERPLAAMGTKPGLENTKLTDRVPVVEHVGGGELENEPPPFGAVETSVETEAKAAAPEPLDAVTAAVNIPTSEASALRGDLADGWVETPDPTTGKLYYYNAATHETTWERPLAAAIKEQELTDAHPGNGVSIQETVTSDQSEEGKGTRLGIAMSVQEAPDTELNHLVADVTAAEDLADGWVETTDPASGQKYYYNAATHETSWDRPLAATPKELVAVVEQHVDESAVEGYVANVEREEGRNIQPSKEMVELPIDWVERTDPNSGQVYFYNTATYEKSWERPVVREPPTALEYTREEQEKRAEDRSLEDTFAVLNAEFGYEEDKNLLQGGDRAKESIRKKPEAEATVAAENAVAPSERSEEMEQSDMSERQVQQQSDWEKVLDPSSGSVFYHNPTTGETSWDSPSVPDPPPTDEVMQQEQRRDLIDTTAALNVEMDAEQFVEPGRRADADSSSGRGENSSEERRNEMDDAAHEANMAGESDYDWPSSPENETSEDTSPEVEAEDHSSHSSEVAILDVDTASLPEGWAEAVDPSSGNIFYYKSATGETSWDHPQSTVLCEGSERTYGQYMAEHGRNTEKLPEAPVEPECDAPLVGDSPTLPEGWTAEDDPATGRTFYYNYITSKTSWDRPMSEVNGTDNTAPPHETSETSSHGINNEPAVPIHEEPEGQKSRTGTTILPTDWNEAVDPSTGSVYYYNAATQESSWNPPPVEDTTIEYSIIETKIQSAEVHEPKEGDKATVQSLLPSDTYQEGARVPEASPKVDALQSENDLPKGWAEVRDNTTDGVYFYNAVTQKTSWEKPNNFGTMQAEKDDDLGAVVKSGKETQATPFPEEDIAEREDRQKLRDTDYRGIRSEGTSIENQRATPSHPSITILPEGWAEGIEHSTGQKFYYNERTGETSWEPPDYLEDNEVMDGVIQETEAIARVDPDALPLGWEEAVDPSTGNTYYFNAETGDSSWKMPVCKDGKRSNDIVHGLTNGSFGHDNGLPTNGVDISAQRINGIDSGQDAHRFDNLLENTGPGTGRIDSSSTPGDGPSDVSSTPEMIGTEYNEHALAGTVESSVSQEAEVLETVAENTEAEVDEATSSGGLIEERHNLPENWTEVVDPTTKQTYYYNIVTLRTSWDKPPAVLKEANGSIDNETTLELPGDEREGALPLQEGWIETIDPSSGQVYYYNASTSETCWERPVAAEQPEAMPVPPEEERVIFENPEYTMDSGPFSAKEVGDVPAITTKNAVHVADSEAEVTSEVDKGSENLAASYRQDDPPLYSLPEFWTQTLDFDSGRTYYYNTLTQEVSWTPPEGAELVKAVEPEVDMVDDGESAQEYTTDEAPPAEMSSLFATEGATDDATNAIEEEESPLPDGWVGIEDEHGQPYYFNEATGQTAWDVPISEDEKQNIGKADSERLPNKKIAASILPMGWTPVEDPQTSVTYYHNKETGETSWEVPHRGSNVVSSVRVEDTDVDVVADTGLVKDGTAELVLPEGWISEDDPRTGQTYYVKRGTSEISWVFPQGSNDARDLGIASDTAPSPETDAKAEAGAPNLALPEGWAAMEDPQTGHTYYCNEGTDETSWEIPVPSQGAEPEQREGKYSVETSASDERGTTPSSGLMDYAGPSALPEGWEETVDESSGAVYFYNDNTGETSWDAPAGPSAQPQQQGVTSKNETAEVELPSGWVEVVDSDSGDVYYVNEIDNSTTWERPINSGRAPHLKDSSLFQEQPTSSHTDKSLPSGWVEIVDAQYGDVYYVNESTNETTWEKPIRAPGNGGSAYSKSGKLPRSQAPSLDGWVEPERHASPRPGGRNSASGVEQEVRASRGEDAWNSGYFGSFLSEDDSESILSIGSCEQKNAVVAFDACRSRSSISGPLWQESEAKVLAYIHSKCSFSNDDILWQLINVAAKSRGKLRSDDGTLNSESPESAIVKILLENPTTAQSAPTARLSRSHAISQKKDIDKELSAYEVEDLLLRGKRVEAVEEAIACRDYATALLVGRLCDNEIYVRATIAFAQNAFNAGSPMHTAAMLFSGGLQTAELGNVPPGLWGVGSADLKVSWRRHLAAILSNRIAGWDSIVVSLGDRLREIGEIDGSHFCYMVCGCPISSPLKEGTRICLLGVDHSVPQQRALMTSESVEAFDRTEAYEWAKRQGNKQVTLKSFQPFKIVFAAHLADAGLDKRAISYVDNIWAHSDIGRVHGADRPLSLNGILGEDSAQALALSELGKKLGCYAVGKPHGKPDSIPQASLAKDHNKNDRNDLPSSNESEVPMRGAGESRSSEQLDSTFLSAKSNLMDITGYMLDTPERTSDPQMPISVPITEKVAAAKPPEAMKAAFSSQVGALSQQPANSSRISESQATPEPSKLFAASIPTQQATPKAAVQPKTAPSTAPSVLMGKKPPQHGRTPAPSSSEKKGGWSIRQRLVKWINPDATEVSLPENEEKPYFDENRKIWVFPGDNPDDLVKPIAPPPTMDANTLAEPAPAPSTPSNDPLAAMMAPPPRGPSSSRRPGVGHTPRGIPGAFPVGGPTPALSNAPPPQFSVFKPKATEEENKKNDE